jgi:hypothetical protein
LFARERRVEESEVEEAHARVEATVEPSQEGDEPAAES